MSDSFYIIPTSISEISDFAKMVIPPIDIGPSGVTPGSYTNTNLTVNSQGIITSAVSGSASGISGGHPTARIGPTVINGVATTFMRSDAAPALADTTVSAGSYTNTNLTVDSQGRITSAVSGTTPAAAADPTATIGPTVINGVATTFMRSDAAPALADTTVSAGSYTNTNLTVDSQGRITDASSSTSIVLSETTAPSTASNTGALFVSDGTTLPQVNNKLYYRNQSDGDIIEVVNPPNQRIITQLSDFPTPVSGVITIDPTIVYIISGLVDIGSNVIESSGGDITMQGASFSLDGVTTSSTNPLFTQSDFGITMSRIQVQNTGGPVFALTGTTNIDCFIDLLQVKVSGGGNTASSFGTFTDIGLMNISNSVLEGLGDGITMTGTNTSVIVSETNVVSPVGTFTAVTIPAGVTFGDFYFNSARWEIGAGQTGFDINTSTIIVNPPARVDDISFSGAGTYLSGITKASAAFEFFQNAGILNSIVLGSVTLSTTPSTITVPTADTYQDITTTPVSSIYTLSTVSERFTLPQSEFCELTYSGVKQITANISIYMSVESASGNKNIAIAIYKNIGGAGPYVQCPDSEFICTAGPNPVTGISQCFTTLLPGDKIKPQIKNITSATDLIIYSVSMSVNTLSL